MVGGTIIDIVKVSPAKWWVNCLENRRSASAQPFAGTECAIYLNPGAESPEVGDQLWWQGRYAMWTPADRSRTDVKLDRIGFSGVSRPEHV